MKKTLYLILIGLLAFSPVLAANYPVIMDIDINSDKVTASEYIAYIFYLLVGIGAVFAVILLSIAGLEWASSGGDPGVINSAKKKIGSVFAGLVLLLAVYIVLFTINPNLLKINIDDISEQVITEVEIPPEKGLYLYNGTNYESERDPLRVQNSRPSLLLDEFYKEAESIDIVQPETFNLGAILFKETKNDDGKTFSGTEYKGSCVYILNSIPDLDSSNGNENNPPLGNDKLESMIVFRTPKEGSLGGTITLYNNFNCQVRSNKYCIERSYSIEKSIEFPCFDEEEKTCVITGGDGFQNLEDVCPDFKRDIISIKTEGDVGILFKDAPKDEEGRCQLFRSGNTNCINMMKYGSMYYLIDSEVNSIIHPESFVIFSIFK